MGRWGLWDVRSLRWAGSLYLVFSSQYSVVGKRRKSVLRHRIRGRGQNVGRELEEEYRSRDEREYARCRIAEYRFAAEDGRGWVLSGDRKNVRSDTGQVKEAGWLVS